MTELVGPDSRGEVFEDLLADFSLVRLFDLLAVCDGTDAVLCFIGGSDSCLIGGGVVLVAVVLCGVGFDSEVLKHFEGKVPV